MRTRRSSGAEADRGTCDQWRTAWLEDRDDLGHVSQHDFFWLTSSRVGVADAGSNGEDLANSVNESPTALWDSDVVGFGCGRSRDHKLL